MTLQLLHSQEVPTSSHCRLILTLNKKEVKSYQISKATKDMAALHSVWFLELNTVSQDPFALNIGFCGWSVRAECFDHVLFTVPTLHVRDEGQGIVTFWQFCVTPSCSYSGKCPDGMFKLTSNLIYINTKKYQWFWCQSLSLPQKENQTAWLNSEDWTSSSIWIKKDKKGRESSWCKSMFLYLCFALWLQWIQIFLWDWVGKNHLCAMCPIKGSAKPSIALKKKCNILN